jgi:hypothetical protein
MRGDDDLLGMNPPDLSSLIMLGTRGIESWCRPYPLETTGDIRTFKFDMASAKFELSLRLPALEEDPLVRDKTGQAGEEAMGYTKLYLPYVHYLATNPPSKMDYAAPTKRILGNPDKEGSEWIKGRGPAQVDLEVVELSEGTLTVEGQWGMWRYPLGRKKEREVKLVVKPWKGSRDP